MYYRWGLSVWNQTIFSTLGSTIKIEPGRGWRVSVFQDGTLRNLLRVKLIVIHDENNLSDNPVDIT